MNMAKGNVPPSDFYIVSKETTQSGKGVVTVSPTEAVRRRVAAKLKRVYKRKRGGANKGSSEKRKPRKRQKRKKKPSKTSRKGVVKKGTVKKGAVKKGAVKKRAVKKWLGG